MKNDDGAGASHSHRLLCMAVFGGLLVSTSIAPHAAQAMSAFAAGIPDNIASRGVAVGAGYNYPTRDAAEARALEECLKQPDAPADTRALCKIVAYFDNECVAVSMDPQAGTPGFGWAIAANADEANSQALENCHQTAGADRQSYCVVSLTDCDTQK